MARVYLAQPREAALKEHPSLKSAYVAEDELRRIASEAKPLTPAVGKTIDSLIRQSIYDHLKRGIEPTISPRASENLQYQVAAHSLEHVVGERLLRPESTLTITPQHRTLLVARAEAEIAAKGGKLENGKIQAREIAGNLATLDYPKADNPFGEKSLAQIYERQQQYLTHVAERGPAGRGRGER